MYTLYRKKGIAVFLTSLLLTFSFTGCADKKEKTNSPTASDSLSMEYSADVNHLRSRKRADSTVILCLWN